MPGSFGGRAICTIIETSPTGETEELQDIPIEFRGEALKQNVTAILMLDDLAEGIYTYDLLLGGRFLTRLLLQVVFQNPPLQPMKMRPN